MVEQASLFKSTQQAASAVSLPFGVPFARAFARKLLADYNHTPLSLADVTIWVPSRRAALSIEEAFLGLRPNGLVMPRIQPMHLTEEDAELLAFDAAHLLGDGKAPVSEHARLLYLAQQVLVWQKATGSKNKGSIPHAYDSAASLAALSDRLRTQQVSFEELNDYIQNKRPDLASHWQINLQFLKIVFEHYPEWLAEQDAADPADLRARLLEVRAATYRQSSTKMPTYLVGFTDTTPAGLELMRAVLAHDQGHLVLQGFDASLARKTLPPTHPHYAINRLLQALDVNPETVQCPELPSEQGALLMHSQAPAGETHNWLHQVLGPECAEGLSIVEAPNSRLEADTIALMMRETLTREHETCALVTTDRQLATRVADKLRHWDITVNDSAGTPLLVTTAGSFFMRLSQTVAENFKPQVVAQLLAHPLAAGGLPKKDWKDATRTFEATVLRGVRPGFGLPGLRQKTNDILPELREKAPRKAAQVEQVLNLLDHITAPLRRQNKASLRQWVQAHVAAGKAMAVNDKGENEEVFLQHEDGDVLFQQLEALMHAEGQADKMHIADYHNWLDAVLSHATVREVYAQHPRLFIWGPLEARLQQADRVIIGGLNEGTWPNLPKPDPWLNRAMADELGLPPRDMAIGLNAHDFCALASARQTFLTRAVQQGGTPTVPSRYLLRLKAVLANHHQSLKGAEERGTRWLEMAQTWATSVSEKPQQIEGAEAPVDKSVFPAEWSASAVATFMQCPYRFYGEKGLGLKPFEAFDQAPDAADKGQLIHTCFEAFIVRKEGLPPPWQGQLTRDNLAQAQAHLMAIAEQVFSTLSNSASRKVWLSRFDVAATAFIETLFQQQTQHRTPWKLEVKGHAEVGGMHIHARADRIDSTALGAVVLDYKTGSIPKPKTIKPGLTPQLPLEGVILEAGGFGSLTELAGLEYWKVGHGEAPFTQGQKMYGEELDAALEATRAGLAALNETFLSGQTPLHALPDIDTCRLCDFAGVCRRHEWQGNSQEGAQ